MASDHADRSIEGRKHGGHRSNCVLIWIEGMGEHECAIDRCEASNCSKMHKVQASIHHYKDATPQRTPYTAPTASLKDAAQQQCYSMIHPAALATGLTQFLERFKTQMTQKRPLFSREGFWYGSGRLVTFVHVIGCC